MNKAFLDKSIKKFIKKNQDWRERKDAKAIEHFVYKNNKVINVRETQIDMENFIDAVLDQYCYERFEVYRVCLTYENYVVTMTCNRIVIDQKGYDNKQLQCNLDIEKFYEHGGFDKYAEDLVRIINDNQALEHLPVKHATYDPNGKDVDVHDGDMLG